MAYTKRIEMHAHTKPTSSCSDITPEELINTYQANGYDAVCLTNHFYENNQTVEDYISAYRKTKALGEKAGLTVLLGMEIRFARENVNDYLVYGITEEDVSRAATYLTGTIEEFYCGFKNERNVILQAHPFRNNMTPVDPALLDGIEAFNLHPNHNSRIGIAGRFIRENPDRIAICGTDFHHLGMEALCALTTSEVPENSEALATILKSGDFGMEIGPFHITR